MASRELHPSALALCLLNGLDPDQQPGFAGIGRIYRSRARVTRTGANVLSIHDFKILEGCGGKISPLRRGDPASSGGSGKIRDPAVAQPEQPVSGLSQFR
jgi:hypothetical protein